jgi:hypothetical protein
MRSPFWRSSTPGIVLNGSQLRRSVALFSGSFGGFTAGPAQGTQNVENTLAETFNLD